MSTAYLRDTAVSRIDHELGALVLESKTHSTRYLPLQFLTRIVSSGAIDWSSTALASCMNAAIPIALIDSQGDNLGFISPANLGTLDTHSTLNTQLKNLPFAADFDDWTRSRERFNMLRSINAKNLLLQDLREERIWQFLCATLEEKHPTIDPIVLDEQVQGLCRAWLYQELSAAGLQRTTLLGPVNGSNITLLDAFNHSIRWILRARYAHWLHSASGNFKAEFAFENMSNILDSKLRAELNALSNWTDESYRQHGH